MDKATLAYQGLLRHECAVKMQIWIAVCVYLLIAITKKRLKTNMTDEQNRLVKRFQIVEEEIGQAG